MRALDPSKVLITSRGRLRLCGGGIFDVLSYDTNATNPMALVPHYQVPPSPLNRSTNSTTKTVPLHSRCTLEIKCLLNPVSLDDGFKWTRRIQVSTSLLLDSHEGDSIGLANWKV